TTGPALSQVVNPADTATSVSVNPSSGQAVFGQNVGFTVQVAAKSPGGGVPTGNVTLTLDGSNVTLTLDGTGKATYSTSSLGLGGPPSSATYANTTDSNRSGSSTGSLQVNAAGTSTMLSSSANPTPFNTPVTFTATVGVSSPSTAVATGSVTF